MVSVVRRLLAELPVQFLSNEVAMLLNSLTRFAVDLLCY